jgi:hypothetical protein
MRKSGLFTLVTSVNILLAALFVLHARHSRALAANGLAERAGLVRSLRLTDLCLFTEARYTRHPAMADRFAPFQDHPGAMEHFPSGSLVTPPITRTHEHAP